MSTPQPPANGEQPTPEEAPAAAPAKRTPVRPAAKTSGGAVDRPAETTPATRGVRGPAAAKPPVSKRTAARPGAAKPTASNSATSKPPTSKPSGAAARRGAAAKPPVSDDVVQGDAPEIMNAALAGHNAFLAGEPEPEPASAGAATSRVAGDRKGASTGSSAAGQAEPGALSDDAPTAVLPDAAGSAAEAGSGSTTETKRSPTGTVSPPPPTAGTGYSTSDGTLPPGAGHPRTVTDYADRLDDTRFFSTLFDFSFTGYVTRKLAGPVYVVGLVLIALSTLLSLMYSLTVAIQTHSFLGAFVFLFGVLITLVGTVLAVLLLRVGIEVFVAIIEIAQNTRERKKDRL